jgi:hypothetical protein
LIGTAIVYSIGRRITGGRVDGIPFSMGAVALCTMSGLLGGLYFVVRAPIEAGIVLGLGGAFGGTFVPTKACNVLPTLNEKADRRSSGAAEQGDEADEAR